MNEEVVADIHIGMLCSFKKKWNQAIDCNNGGTRGYHSEQTKSKGEQISDDITHL